MIRLFESGFDLNRRIAGFGAVLDKSLKTHFPAIRMPVGASQQFGDQLLPGVL